MCGLEDHEMEIWNETLRCGEHTLPTRSFQRMGWMEWREETEKKHYKEIYSETEKKLFKTKPQD